MNLPSRQRILISISYTFFFFPLKLFPYFYTQIHTTHARSFVDLLYTYTSICTSIVLLVLIILFYTKSFGIGHVVFSFSFAPTLFFIFGLISFGKVYVEVAIFNALHSIMIILIVYFFIKDKIKNKKCKISLSSFNEIWRIKILYKK